MSRPLRTEYPDAWYHMINLDRRTESIFSDKRDFLTFLDLLIEIQEMWQVNIAAYCLMSNHSYNVGFNELLKTQRGTFNKPRNTTIYLLRQLKGDSLSDIGEVFKIITYSAGQQCDPTGCRIGK